MVTGAKCPTDAPRTSPTTNLTMTTTVKMAATRMSGLARCCLVHPARHAICDLTGVNAGRHGVESNWRSRIDKLADSCPGNVSYECEL